MGGIFGFVELFGLEGVRGWLVVEMRKCVGAVVVHLWKNPGAGRKKYRGFPDIVLVLVCFVALAGRHMSDIQIDPTPPPPPEPRATERRLTEELKALPAGSSFVAEFPVANAYAVYARRKGFQVVTKKEPDGRTRVWRTA